jgi:hypothetical protein
MTSLNEAYGDPDHVNIAKQMLAKLCQGNQDFIMYYIEFQCLIADLDWNNIEKWAALHHSLSEELKDILSTQDLPEDWANYIALIKRRDMQYCAWKAESYYLSIPNKLSIPSPYTTAITPNPHTPHPTSTGSSLLGPAQMDLLAARCHLSPKEWQKQIDESQCLYCRGFNYIAWDCPNKPRMPSYSLWGTIAMTESIPEVPTYADSNLQLGNM